jgi:hypothetical protein
MKPSAGRGNASFDPVPGRPLRAAFLGSDEWLQTCAPASLAGKLRAERFSTAGPAPVALEALERFAPTVSVIFDPPSVPRELLEGSPGLRLGVLVGDEPDPQAAFGIVGIDRLVSFRPALTGRHVGAHAIWRAVPPPVSDGYFGEVLPLRHAARPMSIGRATEHREAMLTPAKHHHDLLQLVHGVSGPALAALLREHDVGVYVAPRPGGGFGAQVGVHLAAGQLLMAERLSPGHGLERDIDYLEIDSPEGLEYALQRLARFPEMYQRVRVRGRMKAEQFRASGLFLRLLGDFLADVRVFGRREL